jgi:hypothetical protein
MIDAKTATRFSDTYSGPSVFHAMFPRHACDTAAHALARGVAVAKLKRASDTFAAVVDSRRE